MCSGSLENFAQKEENTVTVQRLFHISTWTSTICTLAINIIHPSFSSFLILILTLDRHVTATIPLFSLFLSFYKYFCHTLAIYFSHCTFVSSVASRISQSVNSVSNSVAVEAYHGTDMEIYSIFLLGLALMFSNNQRFLFYVSLFSHSHFLFTIWTKYVAFSPFSHSFHFADFHHLT